MQPNTSPTNVTPGPALPTPAIEPPTPLPAPPPETPTVVSTPQALDAVLGNLAQERVMWIKLEKSVVSAEKLDDVREWVNQGGILWLSTDLAEQFGFPVIAASERRTTMFTNPSVHHDVLQGISGRTAITIGNAPGDVLIVGKMSDLAAQMTPLLAWSVSASSARAFVACAEQKLGQGLLIFRPRQIDTTSEAGRMFEENLRAWSFKVARVPHSPEK